MLRRTLAEDQMRILHVIDGIGIGGGEYVLVRLVEQLQVFGYHNTILSLMRPGPLAKRLVAAGAVVESLDFAGGRLPGPAALRLRAAFRRHQPDIVQGWMYHGNIAASFGAALSGCTAPVAWSVHNALEQPLDTFKWFTRLAIRLSISLSRRVDAIVYVSSASALQHGRLGFCPERSMVIHNGTDCVRFRPNPAARGRLRAELGLAEDTPLVGLFARWDPVKGHTDLLAATRLLIDQDVRLHLVLAGSEIEPANNHLAAAIDAAGLRPHISLLGARDDIETIFPGIDVFALSSLSEAFPLVLGEAMAAGVPCVATDVGDCALIVDDTGYIVPAADPIALASAIRRLLEINPQERWDLGDEARRRVLEHFSLAKMIRQYESLYCSLTAHRSQYNARGS